MAISIEFLGMQRVVTNINSLDMPVNGKTRVNDALEYIRQRYPDLNLDEQALLVTVNLEMAALDRVLNDNDTVSFLPCISGG